MQESQFTYELLVIGWFHLFITLLACYAGAMEPLKAIDENVFVEDKVQVAGGNNEKSDRPVDNSIDESRLTAKERPLQVEQREKVAAGEILVDKLGLFNSKTKTVVSKPVLEGRPPVAIDPNDTTHPSHKYYFVPSKPIDIIYPKNKSREARYWYHDTPPDEGPHPRNRHIDGWFINNPFTAKPPEWWDF